MTAWDDSLTHYKGTENGQCKPYNPIAGMVICAINPWDGGIAHSVNALALHCQATGVAGVMGSSPSGRAFEVDFFGHRHSRVYTSPLFTFISLTTFLDTM